MPKRATRFRTEIRLRDSSSLLNRDCILESFPGTTRSADLLKSMTLALTPKTIIAISVSMLFLAAVFCVLNRVKVKGLRADVSNFAATHEATASSRVTDKQDIKAREAAVADAARKLAESETKAAKAEADLTQAQKEKADLRARVEAND